MSDPLSLADTFEREYWAVQKVLDEALGTEPEDGAGGGIAAEVYLLMDQRNEARAEVDRLRADLADARQRIAAAQKIADEHDPAKTWLALTVIHNLRAALSAGGTDPTGDSGG